MNLLHLYLRRTFNFDSGWSSYDDHTYLCTARVPAPRVTKPDYGGDDAGVYQYTLHIPAGASRRDHTLIKRAIYHTIGGTSCRHEYDCCGCIRRSVAVKRVSKREYRVNVSAYRNY